MAVDKLTIKQIIADNLNVSIDVIVDDLAVGDIPEWDSLGHVRIIMAVEKASGVELDIEQTLDIEDVEDFFDIFLVED